MQLFSILLPSLILAHMEMTSPAPRGSHLLADYPVDYNLNAPLGQAVMCGGKGAGPISAVWRAGQQITVQFHGGARHAGGLCQFALSYDGDQSFQVIQEVEGGCPSEAYEWPVQLPESLPACDRCTFAWTWINAVGNREYYMNCADVRIESARSFHVPSGRPLTLANLPGYPIMQPPASDASPADSTYRYYHVE